MNYTQLSLDRMIELGWTADEIADYVNAFDAVGVPRHPDDEDDE